MLTATRWPETSSSIFLYIASYKSNPGPGICRCLLTADLTRHGLPWFITLCFGVSLISNSAEVALGCMGSSYSGAFATSIFRVTILGVAIQPPAICGKARPLFSSACTRVAALAVGDSAIFVC